jgi:hypothetical protein
MGAYLNDYILDNGLAALADGSRLYFCSAQPADYAGIAAVALGYKDTPVITGPADATPSGRKMTIAAFADGLGTATGDAAYWVLVSVADSRLLTGNDISPVAPVVNGDPFSFAETTVRFPDAA